MWFSAFNPVLQVAEYNVPVLKLGYLNKKEFKSIWHPFTYKLGTEYKQKLGDIEKHGNYYCISEGFHSYATTAKDIYWTDPDEAVLAHCVIPKGSHFYINEFGEIVSDCIKVVASIDEAIKLRKRANLEIIAILSKVVKDYPDLRFCQLLDIMKINESHKDKFFEESVETLRKLKDEEKRLKRQNDSKNEDKWTGRNK